MKKLIHVVVAFALVAFTAQANLVIYANRTAFEAANPGLDTIDFTGLSGVQGYYGLGLTSTLHGVTFSTTAPYPDGGELCVLDPSHYGPEYGSHSGEYLWNNAGSSGIHIALPSGTTVFGADFFAWGIVGVGGAAHRASSTLATLTVEGGAAYQLTVQSSPNSTFWGFISDTPVTGLLYDTGVVGYYASHVESIDNVSFTVVPEPSAAVLALLGLGVVAILGQPGGSRQRRDDASVPCRTPRARRA